MKYLITENQFDDKIRGLYPILKNIKLGPKYEFYSHYYE
jgi:hypothetical protein